MDKVAEAIVDLVQERREELSEESFRAVMDQRNQDNERRLARLETRMDGILLLLMGSIVAQVIGGLLARG